MLCPNCHSPLDLATYTCGNGHRFSVNNGVLQLLSQQTGRRLKAFAALISTIRAAEGRRIDPSLYPQLPYAPALAHDHEWRLRRYDLAQITHILRGRGPLQILDIGAWNGWLSYRLALQGHQVTAVDYFDDQYDGLQAQKFYSAEWRSIQLDLADIQILGRYDIVILNRCLQFFSEPAAYLRQVMACLAPGGHIIATGLQVYCNPQRKAAQVERLRVAYKARYGLELFFRPTRGYLDLSDMVQFKALGLTIHSYSQLWLANLRTLIDQHRPAHYYGIYSQ